MTVMLNALKTDMSLYYELLMTILHKSKYVNHSHRNDNLHDWERMALLLFVAILRMRNNQLFTWMGIINAAAYWTSSGGNMAVLFGHKVTRATMVRKLNSIVTPDECERRTIETLSKPHFVVWLDCS